MTPPALSRLLPGRGALAVTALIALFGLGAVSPSGHGAEFDPLDSLAQANGAAYLAERNALLDSHPAPWDVTAAAIHDWNAGLAAFVLNAWLANRPLFTEWDAFPLIEKISGKVQSHPAIAAGAPGQVYLVEQIWKTALVPQWRDEAFEGLLAQNLGGPPALWHRVWTGAPPGLLRNVALHALPNDPADDARDLLLSVLGNPATETASRRAALTGLGAAHPPYATSVLVQTLPVWETDAAAVDDGLRALAALADPAARSALHSVALDTLRPESVRLGAVISFSGRPLSEDVAVMETILTSPNPVGLWKRTAMELKAYPVESTRALLHALLAAPPSNDVLYWAIIVLERKGGLVDVPALDAVAQNPAVAEHLRQSAATAIQTIQTRAGPP